MDPKSFSSFDDVPEAQRDAQLRNKQSSHPRDFRRWIGWFLLGLLSAIAGGLVAFWFAYQGIADPTAIPLQSMVRSQNSGIANPSVTDTSDTDISAVDQLPSGKSLLGHRAYEEALASELVSLTFDGSIRLRPVAAEQLEAMIVDAESQGIYPVPLSGFRSIEDQQYLFFEVKAERVQTTTTRAEVSAPPGYSEHHTGYAIDIGDANFPDTHLKVSFEKTPTYQWLVENAPRYSFELSFPKGNPQGIQYEPWHWRFVGDSYSLETFYQDR